MEETKLVIGVLKEMDHKFKVEAFGVKAADKVRVDASGVVLSGHSFGGVTAVKTACELADSEQPCAVMVMDPWYYAVHEQIFSGEVQFKCPTLMIESELWQANCPEQHFNNWDCIRKILKTSKCQDEQENIVVNKIGHEVQTDFSLLAGWELSMMFGPVPQTFLGDSY